MRFTQSLFAGAALVAAVFAVEINDFPKNIEPGKSYTITYSPKDNTPTTVVLRKGGDNNLGTVATLTTSATGGSFVWNVDAALPNANDYALEIKQANSPPNYIGKITMSGSTGSAAPSGSSAASSAASTSASPSASTSTPKPESGYTTKSPAASASGALSTPGSNSTVSAPTLSRTPSPSSNPTRAGTPSNSAGAPANTGAASTLASSPLALIFGAIAALAYLN